MLTLFCDLGCNWTKAGGDDDAMLVSQRHSPPSQLLMTIRGVLIDLSGAWHRPSLLLLAGAVSDDAASVLNGAVAGTLHVDDAVLPGCVEALRRLLSRREIGVRFGASRPRRCLRCGVG